eukprot:CAMPEP_0180450170 /NCGR_PEP_ID=MMETSP1036_2-20121128/18101_1 /TAXON_ID=632150 /ORGANISM="Azadinium spinosum, Strain 3D9" /LENGTH=447 /DNA_ID=CAMNT_0022456603 /DNA_START=27 /DNA_END=1370 /DNA_ORIENTATION=-
MAPGANRGLDAFNAVHAQRKLPYYEVLGVPEDAPQSQIVSAFRKLSLKYHPDKAGGSTEKFQELNKAYKCLKDEVSRRKYDECGFDEDNICTSEVDQFVDAFFGEGARGVDARSPDWRMNTIENYIRIDLEAVPLHMRDIVRIGLEYIVSLDHDFHNVVLMQHARVDILYLMVGLLVEGDLTQEVYESEQSYTISYYDNPLQPGITPMWSDQNVLGSCSRLPPKKKQALARKELNWEEFQRRQKHALAMLENAPADPMVALEEKYRARMLATEHDRNTRAIRNQDIYENDAELDCNEFSNFLSQQKKDKEGEVPSGSADALPCSGAMQGSNLGDPELDSLLTVTQIECSQSADVTERAAHITNDKKTIVNYESYGTKDVLGFNSDGVLFVAKGGKVLRNEGHTAAQKLEPPCPNSQPSARSNSVNFPEISCGCFAVFSKFFSIKADM